MAGHLPLSLRARAPPPGGRARRLRVHLPDLAPFAPPIGQKIRGNTELSGTIGQSSSTMRLDAEAHTELAKGSTLLSSMLAGASRLQLAATLTERSVEIERLTLL